MPRRDGSPGGTPNRIKSFVFIFSFLSFSQLDCSLLCCSHPIFLPTTSGSISLVPAKPFPPRDSFGFARPTPARVGGRRGLGTRIPIDGRVREHKSKAPGRGQYLANSAPPA